MRTLAQEMRLKVERSNVTPVWLLIFLRLVKGEAEGSYSRAWKSLPALLPPGEKCPSVEETAVALVDHGLV